MIKSYHIEKIEVYKYPLEDEQDKDLWLLFVLKGEIRNQVILS